MADEVPSLLTRIVNYRPADADPRRVVAARVLAVLADALQIGLLPLFIQGGLSAVNDALDVAMAVLMVWLVGPHWAFAPTFLAELVPVIDLAPTWTVAVLIATRGIAPAPAGPPTLPGEPPRGLPPGPPPGDPPPAP